MQIYIFTYLLIYGLGGGPVGQPPLALNEKAMNCVKVLWDFQWQTDRIYFKETPDWKALEAANALTSWALT